MLIKKQDYQTAFKLWKPLAKRGLIPTQTNIGLMHYYGRGVKKDYKEAFK